MGKKNETRMTQRLFLSVMPTQALAMGIPSINTLLSSILIGKFLGKEALAAIGFADPLALCLNALTTVLSGGAQMMIGNALGRGDKREISRVFNTTLGLCIGCGLLVEVLFVSLAGSLTVLMGAKGESAVTTAAYIRGIGVGMGFSALSSCLFAFLQMERMDKISSVLSVLTTVVNVGGNLANIFWLHWGAFGAGLFLSLSLLLTSLGALACLLIKGKLFQLSFRAFHRKTAAELLRLGSPGAVNELCAMVRSRTMNQCAYALGGSTAIAAIAVAGNLSLALGNMAESGYAGSARTVASLLVGERDVKSLRQFQNTMAKVGIPLNAAIYALIFILARPFALLMGVSGAELSLYVFIIRVYNLWFLPDPIVTIPATIYQALGRVRIQNIACVLCSGILPVLLCLALSEPLGLVVPIAGHLIPELLVWLYHAILFTRQAHRFPRSPFELCYIPSSLSVPREDRYDAVVATTEDAVAVSRGAVDFCKARGLDGKIANYCGLCIEELAVDAVQNRFSGKKATLDVRMLYEDGHIRILFRDDCGHFDPNEWLALCTPEDASRSIGIRMVSKLARRMEYNSTLGLNVLTVEL